jgi:hypothetical protein
MTLDEEDRPFNALTVLETFKNGSSIHKIHSSNPINLNTFFETIDYSYQKEWYSYAKMYPGSKIEYPSIKLDQGLYYLSGFERVFSTMESQCVMGLNLANVLNGKKGSEFADSNLQETVVEVDLIKEEAFAHQYKIPVNMDEMVMMQ